MTMISIKKKVIIIGAGIAGLAAYRLLSENGFEVVILEARNRIGGRIHTDYALGRPFGRGANWIHGIDNNPIAHLANEAGSRMVAIDPKKFTIYDRNGSIIPKNAANKFNEKFNVLLKKANQFALDSNEDISLLKAILHCVNYQDLSPLDQDLFDSQLSAFESYMGAKCDSLSGRHWELEEWPGANCFVTDSYQPLLDNLSRDCNVILNTAVEEITYQNDQVQIATNNNTLHADAVIVTVPLGVLKNNRIHFNPPLPDNKITALKRLNMAVFNLTALKFSKRFWPQEDQAMFFTQFDDSSIPVFFNLGHFTDETILVGISGGDKALKLEKFTDEELISKTIKNFSLKFGIEIPKPESFVITRWSEDPFSYGSFSYVPTGTSAADFDALAEPISNSVYFAGEATSSRYAGTTHGAYLTGIREANRIIQNHHTQNI